MNHVNEELADLAKLNEELMDTNQGLRVQLDERNKIAAAREDTLKKQLATGERLSRALAEEQEKNGNLESMFKQLSAQFNDMVRQRDQLADRPPKETLDYVKDQNEEIRAVNERCNEEITQLLDHNKQLREQNADTIMAMDNMRRQGGLVVYALDRALQLTELFMSCWPANMPMHPGVTTAKHALDEAMMKIGARGPVGPS